jgi:hypothetical protein
MARLLVMRDYFAIVICTFLKITRRYVMHVMKTVEEIRHERLLSLIASHGSIAKLNVALGRTRTDSTLSQLKNKSADSKTGVPKMLGKAQARRIEATLGLPEGWMDTAPDERQPTGLSLAEAQPIYMAERMKTPASTNRLNLAAALAVLADCFASMDESTRRKSAGLVADLANDPSAHAKVARAIEAMAGTANRAAA